MRYSIAAALLLASSALATPELAERDYARTTTTTVTKTVIVKATAGAKAQNNHHHHKGHKVKTVYTTVTSTAECAAETPAAAPPSPPSYAPVPAPEPKTSSAPPPPAYTPPAPAYTPPAETPEPKPEPSSPPSYSPPAGGSIADQCVSEHNKYRAQHNAPPVTWSEKLVTKASDSQYHCLFQHMHGTGYGENLAQGYSTVAEAITGWYNEKNQYNYGSGGFSMATGHFTQVVWKGTHEIGCVFQQCSGGPLLRCEYNPPGNYAGEYQSNVVQK